MNLYFRNDAYDYKAAKTYAMLSFLYRTWSDIEPKKHVVRSD